MSGIRSDFDSSRLFFLTATAAQRKHIFRRDIIKNILIESLCYMQTQEWIRLYVFVIMPNHIHFIARFDVDHPPSRVIREFKKHTAKQIIRQFQAERNTQSLQLLRQLARGTPGQLHKVWQQGYDSRIIYSSDFLRQKATYIHNNPCQPQWVLVQRPEEYAWSSARYYLLGIPPIIPVYDVRELWV